MSGTDLTFVTSDGVNIAYDDEGHGRPVVLVHGYDGMRSHWDLQRKVLLDAGYRVVAMDQRGHWASDKPEHGLRISRLGQDLRELIEYLDLEQVTLVGHSMGVSVVLGMISISGTDRLSRLVAVDQSPKITNDDTWSWGVRKVTWDNVYECVHFRAEWGEPELEPPLPASSSMSWTWEKFDHDKVRKLLLDHMVADWRDVLPHVDVPTWVVTGRLSPFYDLAGMEWFAQQVPQASLSVYEESGHCPHVTEAKAFNQDLLAFMAAADPSADA